MLSIQTSPLSLNPIPRLPAGGRGGNLSPGPLVTARRLRDALERGASQVPTSPKAGRTRRVSTHAHRSKLLMTGVCIKLSRRGHKDESVLVPITPTLTLDTLKEIAASKWHYQQPSVIFRVKAAWDDLLEHSVASYNDRLMELASHEELWNVIRAWDKYNKQRRKKKLLREVSKIRLQLDDSTHITQMHGLLAIYELSYQPHNLEVITNDTLQRTLRFIEEPNDEKVQVAASLTIWRLATFTAIRKKLVNMGCFELMYDAVRGQLAADRSRGNPSDQHSDGDTSHHHYGTARTAAAAAAGGTMGGHQHHHYHLELLHNYMGCLVTFMWGNEVTYTAESANLVEMMCVIAHESSSTSIARLAGIGLWSILGQSPHARLAFVQINGLQLLGSLLSSSSLDLLHVAVTSIHRLICEPQLQPYFIGDTCTSAFLDLVVLLDWAWAEFNKLDLPRQQQQPQDSTSTKYTEQLRDMLSAGVNSLWLLSRIIQRDNTFTADHLASQPDWLDHFLRLGQCNDPELYEGILGAAVHLGMVNTDVVHGILAQMFPRVRSMLLHGDRPATKQLCFFVAHQLCGQGYTLMVMDALNTMFEVRRREVAAGRKTDTEVSIAMILTSIAIDGQIEWQQHELKLVLSLLSSRNKKVVLCGACMVSHLSTQYSHRASLGELSAIDGINNVLNCCSARDVKLMEACTGALWILSFEEKNAVRLATRGALQNLCRILSMHNHDNFMRVKVNCIGALWKLSTYAEIETVMTQFDIVASLHRVFDSYEGMARAYFLRACALWLLMKLCEHKGHMSNLRAVDGLDSHRFPLDDMCTLAIATQPSIGVQVAGLFGVQKLCVNSEGSMRHFGETATETIVQLLTAEDTHAAVRLMCLHALLNLSALDANRVAICTHGLQALVDIIAADHNGINAFENELQLLCAVEMAFGALANISKNLDCRQMMYVMKLRHVHIRGFPPSSILRGSSATANTNHEPHAEPNVSSRTDNAGVHPNGDDHAGGGHGDGCGSGGSGIANPQGDDTLSIRAQYKHWMASLWEPEADEVETPPDGKPQRAGRSSPNALKPLPVPRDAELRTQAEIKRILHKSVTTLWQLDPMDLPQHHHRLTKKPTPPAPATATRAIFSMPAPQPALRSSLHADMERGPQSATGTGHASGHTGCVVGRATRHVMSSAATSSEPLAFEAVFRKEDQLVDKPLSQVDTATRSRGDTYAGMEDGLAAAAATNSGGGHDGGSTYAGYAGFDIAGGGGGGHDGGPIDDNPVVQDHDRTLLSGRKSLTIAVNAPVHTDTANTEDLFCVSAPLKITIRRPAGMQEALPSESSESLAQASKHTTHSAHSTTTGTPTLKSTATYTHTPPEAESLSATGTATHSRHTYTPSSPSAPRTQHTHAVDTSRFSMALGATTQLNDTTGRLDGTVKSLHSAPTPPATSVNAPPSSTTRHAASARSLPPSSTQSHATTQTLSGTGGVHGLTESLKTTITTLASTGGPVRGDALAADSSKRAGGGGGGGSPYGASGGGHKGMAHSPQHNPTHSPQPNGRGDPGEVAARRVNSRPASASSMQRGVGSGVASVTDEMLSRLAMLHQHNTATRRATETQHKLRIDEPVRCYDDDDGGEAEGRAMPRVVVPAGHSHRVGPPGQWGSSKGPHGMNRWAPGPIIQHKGHDRFVLDPGGRRNTVTFPDMYSETGPPKDQKPFLNKGYVTLCRFPHVDDCQYCKSLYPHFEYEGKQYHLYYSSEVVCEALDPGPFPVPIPPARWVQDIAEAVKTAPLPPDPVKISCSIKHAQMPQPPPIRHHYMTGCLAYCTIMNLHNPGPCPFYGALPPTHLLLITDECAVFGIANKDTAEMELQDQHHQWRVEKSLFGPRRKMTDSHDYLNTEKVVEKCLEKDLERLNCLIRQEKLLNSLAAKYAQSQGKQNDVQMRMLIEQRVKSVLLRNYRTIFNVYTYYASLSPTMSFAITEKMFYQLVTDAGIPDDRFISMAMVEKLFILVNSEEGASGNEDNQFNDDRALMRHEFLDGFIRIAITKYIAQNPDPAEAIHSLVKHDLSQLASEVLEENDDFRRRILYCREVDAALHKYYKILQLVHVKYGMIKPINGMPSFGISEWTRFLKDAGVFGSEVGARDAILCFCRSRMMVVDELRQRQRTKTLDFIDFLEALTRLAVLIKIPTQDEMNRMKAKNVLDYYDKQAMRKEAPQQAAAKKEGRKRGSSVARSTDGTIAGTIDPVPVRTARESFAQQREVPDAKARKVTAEKLCIMLDHMFAGLAITFKGEMAFAKKSVRLLQFLTKEQARKHL